MKRKLLALVTVIGIVGFSSIQNQLSSKPEGAPSAVAADPSSGFTDCTDCHSGTATTVSNWITTNIPASGYVPGTTYLITATVTSAGKTIFGFEISPQNAAGTLKGTLQLISTATTKLVGANKYITHTAGGNSGTNSRTWTFNWIAPVAGSGAVTFYGSFLGGNNDGNDTGDLTYNCSKTVNEGVPCTVTPTLTSNSDTLCPQDSAILTAGGGATYLWSNGATTTTVKVPAGTYTVTVTAAAGCSATATKVVIGLPKATPTLISSSNVFGVSAKINWTKARCATGYKIQYRVVGAATWKYATVGDTTGKTLYSLTPLTNYEYQISSLYGTASSALSPLKTFTTLCNCPLPNVAATVVSNKSVNFSWVDENCSVAHKIQYRIVGAAAWKSVVVNDPTSSALVSTLTPNKTYEFRSRSHCNAAGTFNSGFTTIGTFVTPLRLGNEENLTSSLNVYPNPSAGQFKLDVPESGVLKVFNMLMQEVYSEKINASGNSISLNLETLPAGLYIVRLDAATTNYQSKIEISK